ncbi:MAG: hypothetical protein ACTSYB_05275 [Candidatus Helarchaeota archaeon]
MAKDSTVEKKPQLEKPEETEKDMPPVTNEVVNAFKLLSEEATPHAIECYQRLLRVSKMSLSKFRSQFHRRCKNLHILQSNEWIKIEKVGTEKIIKPVSPNTIFDKKIMELTEARDKLNREIEILETAKRELLLMYEEGIKSLVFNDYKEFYAWQAKMCNEAEHSIYAVTDRWMLALVREKEIKDAADRGIDIRVIGRLHDNDPEMVKKLEDRARKLINAGAKIKVVREKVRIRFMVIDEESVFFAIRPPGRLEHKGTWIKHAEFVENFVNEVKYIWEKVATDPPERLFE